MPESPRITITISSAQRDHLRAWGLERGLASDHDIIRAALHVALPNLPPDPPARGGSRGKRPLPGQEVRLLEDYATPEVAFRSRRRGRLALRPLSFRAGTTGTVERRAREGAVVHFGKDTLVLVPYRLLEIVKFGED